MLNQSDSPIQDDDRGILPWTDNDAAE
jgi:hypothetical protein